MDSRAANRWPAAALIMKSNFSLLEITGRLFSLERILHQLVCFCVQIYVENVVPPLIKMTLHENVTFYIGHWYQEKITEKQSL